MALSTSVVATITIKNVTVVVCVRILPHKRFQRTRCYASVTLVDVLFYPLTLRLLIVIDNPTVGPIGDLGYHPVVVGYYDLATNTCCSTLAWILGAIAGLCSIVCLLQGLSISRHLSSPSHCYSSHCYESSKHNDFLHAITFLFLSNTILCPTRAIRLCCHVVRKGHVDLLINHGFTNRGIYSALCAAP